MEPQEKETYHQKKTGAAEPLHRGTGCRDSLPPGRR
nr:MAG TPA: hypothetical protein [Bacteriophage sp.]